MSSGVETSLNISENGVGSFKRKGLLSLSLRERIEVRDS